MYFFVNTNKPCTKSPIMGSWQSFATHRSFSLIRAGFPFEIGYRHFEPRFRDVIQSERFYPSGFEQAFNLHSGLWLHFSYIILNQTCFKLRNDSIAYGEVDNRSKKKIADLVKDAS